MRQPDDFAQASTDTATQAGRSEPEDQLLRDVILSTPSHRTRADGIAIGVLAGFDGSGRPLVDIPAFELQGVRARSVAALDNSQVGQQIALGFESADPQSPIILGFMLAPAPAACLAPLDATLDGQKVTLTAADEIELRCGDAAIVLSSDGRVQIRGTYVTSHASATQRIVGGSVNIN